MDQRAEVALFSDLKPREALLWAGRPRQGLIWRRRGLVFLVPGGLLWIGAAVLVTALNSSTFGFAVSGLCVLIGVSHVFRRFVSDAMRRRVTFYGLTDERVIIKTGPFADSMRSLSLENLHDVSVSVRSDGSGSIVFGRQHPVEESAVGVSRPEVSAFHMPRFDVIPEVESVYGQVLAAQHARTEGVRQSTPGPVQG